MTDKTYILPSEGEPAAPEPPRTPSRPWTGLVAWWRRPKSGLRENVETFVIALVLALFVREFVAEARFIPSESMLPTLEVDDRLFVEKLSYRFGLPERGDIVVFTPPARAAGGAGKNAFIKRVIGLPGDRIAIRDGRVWIEGRPLEEPYLNEPPRYPDPDMEALGLPQGRVPAGAVFVMGDNRNNSQDSHVWGPLPIQNIIGRAFFRYWPLGRLGPVRG